MKRRLPGSDPADPSAERILTLDARPLCRAESSVNTDTADIVDGDGRLDMNDVAVHEGKKDPEQYAGRRRVKRSCLQIIPRHH